MPHIHQADLSSIVDDLAPTDATRQPVEPNTYVTFELAGQIFAVDVADVREILDLQPISRLPNAPPDLLGMIDVRNEGIAVVDLPSLLGLHRQDNPEDTRIVVFELGAGVRRPIGVIADKVISVVSFPDRDVEPVPDAMLNWCADAMIGVTRVNGEVTIVLSLSQIFDASRLDPFDFQGAE